MRLIGFQSDAGRKKREDAPSAAALKAERRVQRKKLRAALRGGVSGLRLTLAIRAA